MIFNSLCRPQKENILIFIHILTSFVLGGIGNIVNLETEHTRFKQTSKYSHRFCMNALKTERRPGKL